MEPLAEDTFPKLLIKNAERMASRTDVRDFALGLLGLGVGRGDKVAILGDNRPFWVCAELAAQSIGAASVGLYQDSNLNEVAYVIDHCDAKVVVAEDQEQVDKILEMIGRLPKVKAIIYDDPRGLRGYDSDKLQSFAAVKEQGRKRHATEPGLWLDEVGKGNGEDLALICYTSGTTGFPKGAMLSFRNLLTMALSLHEVDPRRPEDEFVSFLPLAWIGEQMMSVATALAIGFAINFPEEPETAQENIREIGPDLLFGPPRFWENLTSAVQVKVMDTTPFKRFLYERMLPIGYRYSQEKLEGRSPSFWLRAQYGLAWLLLFRALKDRLGVSNLRSASTGGAALGPDVFRFFHAMGVPLRQIYGQTEISGISCVHRGDVRIAEDGEILSRSRAVFIGYYKNAEATEEALAQGWLHSGDAGHFSEEGHLVVIDRLKDVLRLADGTHFSPQFIENRLKFSPYVKEAVVIGKGRPFLTALVCIDRETVGKWAEARKLSYTTYTDLSAKRDVYDLVQKEIDSVNATLPAAARIRKFVLLYKELDADDEELTRTRKVRRAFVEERYQTIIAALYGEVDHIAIDTTIRFQDGKTARIKSDLAVRELRAG